ncbi:MAG: penicillin acylase family protein [Acidimicrobiales bacterium]
MRRRFVTCFVVAAVVVAACSGDDSSDGDAGPSDADTGTSVETTGDYEATIARTEHNVPHISAGDVGSLGFGYGYAFAEDHLCSLADVIVQANSEAASHHGEEHLTQDVVYAALDVAGAARADFDGLEPELQDVIRGYAAGYNAYLSETGPADVPGYCAGQDWVRPIDEYDLAAYYKILSLRASVDPLIDFIASAAPPEEAVTGDEPAADEPAEDEVAWASLVPDTSELGSNGWAIGPERTVDGTTMVAGNPHFPWEGALRFYEVHLTVPGVIDVYGASLLGSPAVNIGFTEDVAWTHTVSAGNRFTAYTLDLVDGNPTRYVYGDEERDLVPVQVTIDVLGEDGNVEPVDQTVWFSHYGPVIDFPGVGWTDDTVLTFRDANADNDEIIRQFYAMNTATSMDDFIGAHRDIGGIPWVNTIAASADGRIWYADTSAAPNLAPEAVAAWGQRVEDDLITAVALDNGVVLLDGSDPLFEWVDAEGARDPGLVPFDDMPALERDDYVFNANDPYWLAHPDELQVLDSPVFGRAERPTSPRTRMNAVQLGEVGGDSGDDGLYTLDELAESVFSNRVFTAEQLVDPVLVRCTDAGLGEACGVLAGWDRRVDLDSRGAVLWREFIDQFDGAALVDAGPLWAEPFDAVDPVGTPSGLAPPRPDGTDPVVDALRAAIAGMDAAGLALDVPLGEVQIADRNGTIVPIHGGRGSEGVTNVVGSGSNATTTEPERDRGEPVEGTSLTSRGYPIANGTSFVYVLEYTSDGPRARSLLTYGQTGEPGSPFFTDQTQRFSAKDWKTVPYPADDVEAATVDTYEVTGRRS